MSDRSITWTVDQITSQIASLEVDDGTGTPSMIRVPAALLPADTQDGDVYRVTVKQSEGRSSIVIAKDRGEADRRLARSRKQISQPPRNDPGGDVTL